MDNCWNVSLYLRMNKLLCQVHPILMLFCQSGLSSEGVQGNIRGEGKP